MFARILTAFIAASPRRSVAVSSFPLVFLSLFLGVSVAVFLTHTSAQSPTSTPAPGAPGEASLLVTAPREAVATSANFESKAWLTLRNGMLAETAWSRPTANHSRLLRFAVTDGKTFTAAEDDPGIVRQLIVTNPRSLSFRQINFHPVRRFSISKNYIVHPDTSTILIDVEFVGQPGQQLYVIYDPALAGTDLDDTASAYGGQGAFVVYEGDVAAALIASTGFEEMSVGFQSASDGWSDLRKHFRLTKQYTKAEKGNVVCVARIRLARTTSEAARPTVNDPRSLHFTLALSFSDEPETALTDAEHALEKGFLEVQKVYEKGWSDWLTTFQRPESKDEAQLNMAVMLLKAQEEKIGRSHLRHSKNE